MFHGGVGFCTLFPSRTLVASYFGSDLSYNGEETPDADLRYETEGIQSGAGGYKGLKGFRPTTLLPLLATIFPNVGETS